MDKYEAEEAMGRGRRGVGPQATSADAMQHHPMPHLAYHITDLRDC